MAQIAQQEVMEAARRAENEALRAKIAEYRKTLTRVQMTPEEHAERLRWGQAERAYRRKMNEWARENGLSLYF